MKITGTFLDEITHDIPSNNWGREEWTEDFRIMKAIGIDTVILIRSGWGKRIAWPSKVLEKEMNAYPVYEDLVDMFLELAEENDMTFFFSTYDSGKYWHGGELQKEIELSKAMIDEAMEKYGHRKAFKGWYLTHELTRLGPTVDCIRELGDYCKKLAPQLPTLISPYVQGSKQFGDQAVSVEDHECEWDKILAAIKGAVDIVAFQDGQVQFDELPTFLKINSTLIKKHGMKAWSNVENFDRDMPFNFPPIDWRKLWWKIKDAEETGVDKLITFEFSHFMSPQSCWPASKNLFNRYCEHYGIEI